MLSTEGQNTLVDEFNFSHLPTKLLESNEKALNSDLQLPEDYVELSFEYKKPTPLVGKGASINTISMKRDNYADWKLDFLDASVKEADHGTQIAALQASLAALKKDETSNTTSIIALVCSILALLLSMWNAATAGGNAKTRGRHSNPAGNGMSNGKYEMSSI